MTRQAVDQAWFDEAPAAAIAARLDGMALPALLRASEAMTLAGHGGLVTYSRKVFIPLTRLCRDVCHYCTFAQPPKSAGPAYLSADEVVAIARAGAAAGCREALFTLGDRPEARYAVARQALEATGHDSTLGLLRDMAALVLEETGLLPHLNPGLLTPADYARLRPVAASMGSMLETAADRLGGPGMPHHGSPDKVPARRLAAIDAAGAARVAFTTGILIGIGESRAERLDALLAIRDSHRRHGHVQEIIIQNFRAKPGTRMAAHPEPPLAEHLWTIAVARLLFGPEMTIQAPPNLRPGALALVLAAGVNDWGGVSPVTPDHVNPEAPWPQLAALAQATEAAGRSLAERLAIGPAFARKADVWLDGKLAIRVRRMIDARGLPITDGWRPGGGEAIPERRAEPANPGTPAIERILGRAAAGRRLDAAEIVTLFGAVGGNVEVIVAAADRLRASSAGEAVSYVVNRNINYTNICLYRCGFCAFSKGSTRQLRGPAYRIDLAEIGRRAVEAWARGATEVCLQGGIHPDYDGDTYLDIVRAVAEAVPGMHVHAFSPLEISHGARTLGLSLRDYLLRLQQAGLKTLPGTAAEILDDGVRDIICPDKLRAAEWVEVMRAAHGIGLRSTATIMFGHVDSYESWARHLLVVRDLQAETGGFTEFVPLPFVHMEAPIWRQGLARSGPSWRECLLMHAVARLVLHPLIPNIQASWVKLGRDGAAAMLAAGVNDLGGTLMDESITRAAGGRNGQLCDPLQMAELAAQAGRPVRQRTTLYQELEAPLRAVGGSAGFR
jgi:FO synthase